MSKELSKELENVSGGLKLEIEQTDPNEEYAGWGIIDKDSGNLICGANNKREAIEKKKKLEAHIAQGHSIESFFTK